MELLSALGIRLGDCVAVVGAGGKTTLCWRLVQAFAAQGGRAIFTTTTRIWQPADGTFDVFNIGSIMDWMPSLNAAKPWRTACLALAVEGASDPTPVADAGMPTVHTKLVGFAPEEICTLKPLAQAAGAAIVVEADGARGRHLKAPGEGEPVVPACSDVVCVLANLDALGLPLDAHAAHRPEHITRLTGVLAGTTITPALIAALLAHPAGGLKGIPSHARRVAVLTQRNGDKPHPAASAMMTMLCGNGFDRVVVIAPRAPQTVLSCAQTHR